MEIHYVQVETCGTWSDQNDPNATSPNPLVVFRLVSITNTSAQGTPNITFDLYHLFFVDSAGREHPELGLLVPWSGDIGQQLAPGQSVHYPLPSINGLFAIQDFDTPADVQGVVFYLNYESASDESVLMLRDPSPSTFHPFCGKTALSALQ
jgi:hypothetical protein